MKNILKSALLASSLVISNGCAEDTTCDINGNGENADGPAAAISLCEENRDSYLRCLNADSHSISEISCDNPDMESLVSSTFNTDDYVICKRGDAENPVEIECNEE